MRSALALFLLANEAIAFELVSEAEPDLSHVGEQELVATSGGSDGDHARFDPFGSDDSPYFDNTPICNYLNRGIGDQENGLRDSYILSPPQVNSLSDIKHLWFGLDLPQNNCKDNPRSIPCSDKDDPKDWCVERVELSVAGKAKSFIRLDPYACLSMLPHSINCLFSLYRLFVLPIHRLQVVRPMGDWR